MQKSNYVLGITYASITALLWGFLPILMKIALHEFSSGSIVWFRFTFAFIVLFLFLKIRKKQPESIICSPPGFGILGGIFLAGNYYYFLKGVEGLFAKILCNGGPKIRYFFWQVMIGRFGRHRIEVFDRFVRIVSLQQAFVLDG